MRIVKCVFSSLGVLCWAARPFLGQTWPTWRPTVDLRIDASSNDLLPITFLQVSQDGTLAIGQGQDARVLFFAPKGTRLTSVGRPGAGPGEFRQLFRRAGWLGDSLWVFDRGLARITVIAPGGASVRSNGMPPELRGTGAQSTPTLQGFGWIGTGDKVFFAGQRVDDAGGLHMMLVQGTPAGRLERVVADVPLRRECLEVSSKAFCGAGHWAVSPRGERILLTSVSLQQQHRGEFTATLVTDKGDTVFSRQYSVTTDLLGADDIAARNLAPPELPVVATFERFPAASDLVVGRDGLLWVGQEGKKERIYVVLDGAGRALGSLRFPLSTIVKAADGNFVWTIESDKDGLESVVRYKVTRSR